MLGWREVPTDPSMLGATAQRVMPTFRQLFLAGDGLEDLTLDRHVYVVRKRTEHELRDAEGERSVYFPSLSSSDTRLQGDAHDAATPRVLSRSRPIHTSNRRSRSCTPASRRTRSRRGRSRIRTASSCTTARSTRCRATSNWMRAREAMLATGLIPGHLDRIFPICTPGASDTARFDEVLELLHMGGYSLPHAILMMIPEAWEHHESMDPALRAFYRFHASLMEPWDGPASIAFTDGTIVGAVLDRNGLRPSRYWVTADDLVIMASEVGVIDVDPSRIVHKGRLQPGRMFLVDTNKGRIIPDEEIKSELAAAKPYQEWLDEGIIKIHELPPRRFTRVPHTSVLRRQETFGYTHEELKLIIGPMAGAGAEALGSMGTDTPAAVLSNRPRLLFDYFSQLFAQVTNPPLDAIREELVTAVGNTLGTEWNLLDPGPESCRQIVLTTPVIDNDQFARLHHIADEDADHAFRSRIISCLYPVREGGTGLRRALDDIRRQANEAVDEGINILILSDRHSTEDLAPIPSLLFTGAVHHHLIREKTRTSCGLLVETGDAREVHHMCLLLGYGATAINPYLAFETVEDLIATGMADITDPKKAVENYLKACTKGVLKVMSKMGISTVASYHGAQIFEAIGLSRELVDEYFTGTTSKLGGIGLDEIAAEVARRHEIGYPDERDRAGAPRPRLRRRVPVAA